MRLIGKEKLQTLSIQNRDLAKWLAHWTATLCEAHWKRPSDVTNEFPRAIQSDPKTFVFPIAKHQIAIQVLITFTYGVALITAIKSLEADNEQ